jgi:hypothetical protein
MPLGVAYNSLAQANEQPEYQNLWTPLAVDPASTAVITVPTSAAKAAGWVPGAVLQYNTSGVGSNPGPGGDMSSPSWSAGVPTGYSVQYVDPAATSTTTYLAGILLGVGTLGATAPAVPNTLNGPGPQLIAMVGTEGITQVYVDNNTTIGHTILASTSNVGCASDSGGSTRTYGTHFGIVLQAVTLTSSIPALCWVYYRMP